jgi:RNA recognition motif-containing protein
MTSSFPVKQNQSNLIVLFGSSADSMAEIRGDEPIDNGSYETKPAAVPGDNQTAGQSDDSNNATLKQRESNRKSGRNRAMNKRNRSRSPLDRRTSIVGKSGRRVYVANIPFEVKWTDLKDLFRLKVGNVMFCQIFEDEDGRSRGCGLVEFSDSVSAQRAIEMMNRHNYKGREIVVKEDVECDRDVFGRMLTSGPKKDVKDDRRPDRNSQPIEAYNKSYNTFGLSTEFLDSLGITGNHSL